MYCGGLCLLPVSASLMANVISILELHGSEACEPWTWASSLQLASISVTTRHKVLAMANRCICILNCASPDMTQQTAVNFRWIAQTSHDGYLTDMQSRNTSGGEIWEYEITIFISGSLASISCCSCLKTRSEMQKNVIIHVCCQHELQSRILIAYAFPACYNCNAQSLQPAVHTKETQIL